MSISAQMNLQLCACGAEGTMRFPFLVPAEFVHPPSLVYSCSVFLYRSFLYTDTEEMSVT